MARDRTLEIMSLYIDGAKGFVQLSSAGLVLPSVLKSNVIGFFGKADESGHLEMLFICVSWACFLVAIGTGILYQYVAVKFIEYEADPHGTYVPPALEGVVKVNGPGVIYGAMVVAFYVGAISVVAYSLAAFLT